MCQALCSVLTLTRVRLKWMDFPSRFCCVALGVSIFSPVNCDDNTCPRVGIKGDKPPQAISEGMACGWGIWTNARGTSYLFFLTTNVSRIRSERILLSSSPSDRPQTHRPQTRHRRGGDQEWSTSSQTFCFAFTQIPTQGDAFIIFHFTKMA